MPFITFLSVLVILAPIQTLSDPLNYLNDFQTHLCPQRSPHVTPDSSLLTLSGRAMGPSRKHTFPQSQLFARSSGGRI